MRRERDKNRITYSNKLTDHLYMEGCMRKALVIGINDYPGTPLKGCINDANEVADILRRNEDESINFHVRLETDVKTKGELKGMIEDLFSGTCDDALLYFSGHGDIDAIGGYIVTPDYSRNDAGVSMHDILEFANKSDCKNKIIILDCCHSGSLGLSASTGNLAIIGEGLTVLTACEKKESAVEINGHGIFTALLVDALKGGAADIMGEITPSSVYSYIDRALGAWDQRPMFKTNINKFTSLRKVNPQISLAVLRQITELFSWEGDRFSLDPSFEETNSQEIQHEVRPPYAVEEHVEKFKSLQKMRSLGLVRPVDEEYMYYAALNSKSCELTALGQRYWKLVKMGRI